MENAEWYVDWFNSPYYHLLYNNRNYSEANFFIDKLCDNLKLAPNSAIWDLACGKGRHSIALNKKGFHVIGTDLSVNSITSASQNSNRHLEFFVHDMRQPFKVNYFDTVFNLFTSIGYFKNFHDNYAVFKNVSLALKPQGVFVIDFFNSAKIIGSFKSIYIEQRDTVTFEIKKKIINNAIVKRIEFTDAGKNFYFEETVSLLSRSDFEDFAKSAGLTLENCYGSYKLEAFDEKISERLILIFKK
jgi:SAM-dependent methyltransferase